MKKFLLLIPVFAIAICLYAFKGEQKQQSVEWFEYSATPNANGPADPANYSQIEEPSCSGEENLCAIKVLSDGDEETPRPDEEALINMQEEIADAVEEGQPTENVVLKN
ncbi:MAG TPA: hypothetical protein VLC98_12705 [Phnomibacter sp.]|nr:hypothetical protein [Phnomibacter sp.]